MPFDSEPFGHARLFLKPSLQAALRPDHFYVPVLLISWSKSERRANFFAALSLKQIPKCALPFGKPIRDGGLGVQGKGEV